MREIEVKARLRDKDSVIAKLRDMGCVFSAPVSQRDMVYAEKTGDMETFLSNRNFLRIRVTGEGKVLFTLKGHERWLVAEEHEVIIDSEEELKAIVRLLGYSPVAEVRKARITTEYQGCEICIDEVEKLGCFMEMEKIADEGDPQAIQEEMFRFFETLGVSRADRVRKGYDILMLEKEGG